MYILRLLLRQYCCRGRGWGRENYTSKWALGFYYTWTGLLRVSVYAAVNNWKPCVVVIWSSISLLAVHNLQQSLPVMYFWAIILYTIKVISKCSTIHNYNNSLKALSVLSLIACMKDFSFLNLCRRFTHAITFLSLWASTIDPSSLKLTLYNKWQQELLRNKKTKEDNLGT